MHETVRKEAETSKKVFLLLRSRGMYVQLVPTFNPYPANMENMVSS